MCDETIYVPNLAVGLALFLSSQQSLKSSLKRLMRAKSSRSFLRITVFRKNNVTSRFSALMLQLGRVREKKSGSSLDTCPFKEEKHISDGLSFIGSFWSRSTGSETVLQTLGSSSAT